LKNETALEILKNETASIKNEKVFINKIRTKVKDLEKFTNKEEEYLEKNFISYYNFVLKKKDKIKIEEVDESIEKQEDHILDLSSEEEGRYFE
jgi:peptide methionine sulfoxide reductase MsrA